MKLAARLDHIEPFYVMECAKAAVEIARSPACADSPMIFLNIGEPDFTAPPLVLEAAGPDARYADALALRLHAAEVGRDVLRCCHQLLGAIGFCDEHDVSVLDRHLQPLLRLPCSAEALADRLVPTVSDGALESLFAATT